MFVSIQAGRAIAAMLVVAFHLGGTIALPKYWGIQGFGTVTSSGNAGVEFFFVLSGFIITWAHASDVGHPSRLFHYLRKRFARIYPTFWIVFASVSLLALAVPTLRAKVPHDLLTLTKTLALVPTNEATLPDAAPVIVVAWSLQYEIFFYALVGVFIASARLGAITTVVLVLNWGLCTFGSTCTFPQNFASDWIVLFLFGVTAAIVTRSSLIIERPRALAAFAAVSCLFVGLVETVQGQGSLSIDRRYIYGSLVGVMLLGLARAELTKTLNFRSRTLGLLGDSSYALYLLHFPMISVLVKVAMSIGLMGVYGAVFSFCLIFANCVGVSMLFHIFIERPIIRYLGGSKSDRHEQMRVVA